MRRSSQSYMADSRFPTMDGSTSTTSVDYNQQGLTGTIPTGMICGKYEDPLADAPIAVPMLRSKDR